jgi:hypothetical protein
MAHKSFSHKGYDIYIAAFQPSKRARGGTTRTLQICLTANGGRMIKKKIKYDSTNAYAFGEASEKAVKWIEQQLEKQK